MATKMQKMQEPSKNGHSATIDHSQLAELVGVEHDQPETSDDIDDALTEHAPAPLPKPPVDIDLDDALGDEQALKHGLLDHEPPPIEVRVPRKREYIMVHSSMERVTQVIEYTAPEGIGRAYYLASSRMRRKFEDEDLKTVRLVLCMSLADRSLFIWPMNEDDAGVENRWNDTTRHFVEHYAKKYWARRVSLRKSGGQGYGYRFAPEGHALPQWPERPFQDIITEVFSTGDRLINCEEHPVYRSIMALP